MFRFTGSANSIISMKGGVSPNDNSFFDYQTTTSGDFGSVSLIYTPTTPNTYITFGLQDATTTFSAFLKYFDATEINAFQGDPQVMLRWSDDGGHTWSNEHWASMGKIGEYGKRVIWRRLGMTTKLRDRVYEISGSDPVKIAIMGAELTATPTSA